MKQTDPNPFNVTVVSAPALPVISVSGSYVEGTGCIVCGGMDASKHVHGLLTDVIGRLVPSITGVSGTITQSSKNSLIYNVDLKFV